MRKITPSHRSRPPALEALEDRSLLSVSITEFPAPAPAVDGWSSEATAVTAGPDGNIWFEELGLPKIGRITPAGEVTEFTLPSPDQNVYTIGIGPDGNVWYVVSTGFNRVDSSYQIRIGDMSPSGTIIKEFPVPEPAGGAMPNSITTGPDGNLWFSDFWGARIGRVTPTGQVTAFNLPTAGYFPHDITTGPDGNLWFTEVGFSGRGYRIGRITPSGTITEFALPAGSSGALSITTGPDGNLWYTGDSVIGRITPQGQITEFPFPSGYGDAVPSITQGPDGNLWFTQDPGESQTGYPGASYIGQITTDGQITEYPVPTPNYDLGAITTGSDGNLWFLEGASKMGRVTLNSSTLQLPSSIGINPGGAVNGVVATFTVANPQARASDYSATISWGDGSQSTGTVSGNRIFQVSGSHVYAAAAGRFSATVMVHDLSDNVTTYASTTLMIRSPQEVWVRQLYQDLLQRPADDAGVTAWLAQLGQGVSRLQIVHEFEASLEYRIKVVENLYATLLGRPADPAGLAGYVQFLGQGGTAQQVEATILSSAEYYQNRAGENPGSFLSALYHDVLGRPVDNVGAMRWSELLALGFGRDLVVNLVLGSAEAQHDQVEGLYQQFLGRPADSAGLNGFVDSLAQGATMGDVIAAIASSDEFFQRF